MDGFEARARAMGFRTVAGVDEAGRGPLAGPVVAAAVVLPAGFRHPGIRDSKALTPEAREVAYAVIASRAVAFAVAQSSPEEIDRINILQASLLAMRRAVEKLARVPDFLYIDGTFAIPASGNACWSGMLQETIVAGDTCCASVMAASILAKVSRDRMMVSFDRLYPGYGFASHKGYPTKEHQAALRAFGPTPIHRKTFRGVLSG